MPFTDLIVVRIVPGGDLQCTSTKFAFYIVIANDRNAPPQDRHQHLFPDETGIPIILRVYGDCGVARDGFRPGGGHRYIVTGAIRQHVFEVVKRSWLFGVFHLQIRHGRLQPRRPVNHARAFVNQTLLVQPDKGLAHRARQAFIQSKPLSGPVT